MAPKSRQKIANCFLTVSGANCFLTVSGANCEPVPLSMIRSPSLAGLQTCLTETGAQYPAKVCRYFDDENDCLVLSLFFEIIDLSVNKF
jgi:hypothetical protein